MKYLYALALLLLLVSCKEEEKKKPVDRTKTDWNFYKLEGNVKSVSEKSYEAVGNSGQKGSTGHEIASNHDSDLTFNEEGMLLLEKKWINGITLFEETNYSGREKMVAKIQFINGQKGIKTEQQYDKAGNITAIIRRNGDNTQLDRIAMTYSGKNLTEKKSYNGQDNPTDRITYTYDKYGNLKVENTYLNTEYIQVRNLYEYDSQNRMIAQTRYSKDELIYKTTYLYDGKNIVKKETISAKGVTEYSEKNCYDKAGHLLERYTQDSYDKSMMHDIYKYDSIGNLTSWTLTRNNIPETQVLYKYDSHNNAIEVKTSNGKGETVDSREYSYDHDDKGNWTKKTVSVNGKPSFIAERKITYFAGAD